MAFIRGKGSQIKGEDKSLLDDNMSPHSLNSVQKGNPLKKSSGGKLKMRDRIKKFRDENKHLSKPSNPDAMQEAMMGSPNVMQETMTGNSNDLDPTSSPSGMGSGMSDSPSSSY